MPPKARGNVTKRFASTVRVPAGETPKAAGGGKADPKAGTLRRPQSSGAMLGKQPRARSVGRPVVRSGSQSARSDGSHGPGPKVGGGWQPPPAAPPPIFSAAPVPGSGRRDKPKGDSGGKGPGWRDKPVKTTPMQTVLSPAAGAPAIAAIKAPAAATVKSPAASAIKAPTASMTVKAQPVKKEPPPNSNGTSPTGEANRPSRRKRKIGLASGKGLPEPEAEETDGRIGDGVAELMKEAYNELHLDGGSPNDANKEESEERSPGLTRTGSSLDKEEGWAETMENFGIVPKDLRIDTLTELGRNKLGVVYHGNYQATEVAVKLLVADGRSYGGQKEWRGEVAVLSKLRHPNVLQMLGAVFDPSAGLAIVTELCPDGTVRSAVWEEAYGNAASWTKRLMSGGPSMWMRKLEWLLQITKGMAFLHYKRVFHRDLKASNVLLSGGSCKITGFGMSGTRRDAEMALRLKQQQPKSKEGPVVNKTLQTSFAAAQESLRTRRRRTAPERQKLDASALAQSTSTRLESVQQVLEEGKEESGTFAYCAPEVWPEMKTSKPFSNAADVYSFGVLLIEVVAARVPFDSVVSETEAKVARQIAHNLARPRMPGRVGRDKVPGFLRDVATRCLSYVPEERPSFRELIDELRHEVHGADYRMQGCCMPFAQDEPGEEEKVEEFDEEAEF